MFFDQLLTALIGEAVPEQEKKVVVQSLVPGFCRTRVKRIDVQRAFQARRCCIIGQDALHPKERHIDCLVSRIAPHVPQMAPEFPQAIRDDENHRFLDETFRKFQWAIIPHVFWHIAEEGVVLNNHSGNLKLFTA